MRAALGFPWALAAVLASCAAATKSPTQTAIPIGGPWQRLEYEHASMGTLFRIVLHAPDAVAAQRAATAAFARLDEIDGRLSDYAPQSELSRLSRASEGSVPTPWLALSADLYAVLTRAREISQATDGALDVTCGHATRLWRRALRERELPGAEELESARASIDWRALEVRHAEPAARWTRANVRLDLGGIAKGYALDCMLSLLASEGLESALVIGGGDMVAGEPPPGKRAWRVELLLPSAGPEEPRAVIELCRAAVATSGDLYRGAEIDGRRYSHLVDPQTGLALTESRGASVVALDAITADALATAACVLGPVQGRSLFERFPQCKFLLVALGASGLQRAHSANFPSPIER